MKNHSERLFAHLSRKQYVPVPAAVIAKEWKLDKKRRVAFFAEIAQLVRSGQLTLIKNDRVCLPKVADLVTGTINFRQKGSAMVAPEVRVTEPRKPAIYIDAADTGTALQGDKVVVRLRSPRERDFPFFLKPGEQAGRVIEIIERGAATLTGTLHRGRTYFYVTPDDPRIPHDIIVPDPAAAGLKPPALVGDKVVVKLNEWKERHQAPDGEVTQRLGRAFEPRAELAAIYHKYNLATSFPDPVVREAAAILPEVQPSDLAGRRDFRDIPTFTIDPDDAKDFDDALSIEYLDHGEIRVGVHIADVSHYVKPGTALDKEAQLRGNSTYLVGTVVPMLPEKLSNGLCSLVEAKDRLTKAAIFTFNRHGAIKTVEFANTVIRSRKRLTYKQAYALMFEDDLNKIRQLPLPGAHQTGSTGRALNELSHTELTDLQTWVRQLWAIGSKIRQARMADGSLDLDMPETKIFVDAEGYADRIEKIENDESHQLIEEYMLLANEAVARLTRTNRLPSLYRVHDDPDEARLGELRQFLMTFNVKSGDLMNRDEVVRLLATLKHHPQGFVLRTQLLRSMRKACYRPSHDGHYGLNKKDYTHFTSPIRRYADLVVHRVLGAWLAKQPGYRATHTDQLAEHLSLTEINSTEAERDSVKVKLMEYFDREAERKKKTVFNAIITDVRNHGFFIELSDAGAFGMVPISSLRDDFYVLNGPGTAFIGRKTKRKFELGHTIQVIVAKVDRQKRLIDFTVP
ncbi:Ribonuclease R [Lacunisphaera limnophila]|uniref:Ribonuclease R n=1 Tax=Lacunisphaera limnophila TaxID=1838286 RepID=A0A1D8AZ26_9BACT|nr:RNB domain-containing ribonuclease [Lacunisphaera limnophila]AOS46148.1 Ribonuclease R [Lacunisphaera limnophila]